MPELPEVECLTRAIREQILGATVIESNFLRKDLRDPIPIAEVQDILKNETICAVERRSKYMLWQTAKGFCGFHLGMTGNILLLQEPSPTIKHTHAIFTIRDKNKKKLHLHFIDPRRFGRIFAGNLQHKDEHKFLKALGPEPLQMSNLGKHLFNASRHKKVPIKSFLMDQKIVVGVGNIYASEALFAARIHPRKPAGRVSREDFLKLADSVRKTLRAAIKAGGTSFRDFKNSDGSPGYFEAKLMVYDRKGEKCYSCATTISELRLAGRSTFFCKTCQAR